MFVIIFIGKLKKIHLIIIRLVNYFLSVCELKFSILSFDVLKKENHKLPLLHRIGYKCKQRKLSAGCLMTHVDAELLTGYSFLFSSYNNTGYIS